MIAVVVLVCCDFVQNEPLKNSADYLDSDINSLISAQKVIMSLSTHSHSYVLH